MPMNPAARRRYGEYGGRYVPETLVPALERLAGEVDIALADEKFLASFGISHRRIANRAGPNRGYKRANAKTVSGNHVGDFFKFVVAGVRIGVRQEKEVVNPVELLAVHFSGGGQFEHPFETYRGLLALFIPFANQPRPHCVVKTMARCPLWPELAKVPSSNKAILLYPS